MQFLIGNDTSSFSQGHTSQEQKSMGEDQAAVDLMIRFPGEGMTP